MVAVTRAQFPRSTIPTMSGVINSLTEENAWALRPDFNVSFDRSFRGSGHVSSVRGNCASLLIARSVLLHRRKLLLGLVFSFLELFCYSSCEFLCCRFSALPWIEFYLFRIFAEKFVNLFSKII